MTILDNSTRFLLVEKPLAFPLYDIHAKSQEGPLFDLGVDLEYYNGVVYVKAEHIETMGRVLGMATKEDVDTLNARIRELEAEVSTLPNGIEELVNGIDGLVTNYRSGVSAGISSPPYLLDPEPDAISDKESGIDSEHGSADSTESVEIDRDSGNTSGQSTGTSRDKRPAKFSAGPDNEFSDNFFDGATG